MKNFKPGIYKHYKGNYYKVHGLTRHSETLEWLVYYEALYENKESQFWVRPYEMFIDDVIKNGKKIPHFELIEEANSDELLWLVDEDDKEIGTIFKHTAHGNPKYIHREVSCIIVNDEKEILFNKRSPNKKILPGAWGPTAGHVTYPQTYEFAMQREMKEELDLELKLVFVETFLHKLDTETHFSAWFIAKYNGEEINFEKNEISEVKFMGEAEIKGLIAKKQTINNMLQNNICQRYWDGEFDEKILN
ncbi:DUF1653 domain-containing protein [Candidatus Dojkabacteria bacterium]|nr:DUF1653 domain-containing protein [Candidatus Dojkabacteria bacterium]